MVMDKVKWNKNIQNQQHGIYNIKIKYFCFVLIFDYIIVTNNNTIKYYRVV